MDSWNEILDDFSRCADRLEAVLEQIPENIFDRSLDKKSWSIRQIIHHLADGAVIWSMFIRQALGDSGGEFQLEWYWSLSQDEWGEIWHYSLRGVKSSIDLYRACNQSMLDLLRSSDYPGTNHLLFNLPGEESQIMTVEDAVRWQKIHLKQHLIEIKKILES